MLWNSGGLLRDVTGAAFSEPWPGLTDISRRFLSEWFQSDSKNGRNSKWQQARGERSSPSPKSQWTCARWSRGGSTNRFTHGGSAMLFGDDVLSQTLRETVAGELTFSWDAQPTRSSSPTGRTRTAPSRRRSTTRGNMLSRVVSILSTGRDRSGSTATSLLSQRYLSLERPPSRSIVRKSQVLLCRMS